MLRVLYRGMFCLVSLSMVVLIGMGGGVMAADDPVPGRTAVFFSQGQAVYDPQNRAGSQQEAVQDLLSQAVTQAVASYLTPSRMGGRFAELQEKILKQPERYVETYQLFSEAPLESRYRVNGQVTVEMDLLKRDLEKYELHRKEPGGLETSVPPEALREADGREGLKGAAASPREQGSLSRGISVVRPEVLWVVPERWDKEWHLPADRRDPRGLFALSVFQESQDYDWVVRLPQVEWLVADEEGNVPVDQAISRARSLGIQKVVTGSITVKRVQEQGQKLDAILRVVSVGSGKQHGEVRKSLAMGDATSQEGALEMASLIMPQLDSLLRESSRSAGPQTAVTSTPPPSPPEKASTPAPAATPRGELLPATDSGKDTGEWIVKLGADNQYVGWEKLESQLRERFKGMRVRGFQVGPGGASVRIEGVDGQYLSSLGGTRLQGGLQVQVNGFSAQERAVELSFILAE